MNEGIDQLRLDIQTALANLTPEEKQRNKHYVAKYIRKDGLCLAFDCKDPLALYDRFLIKYKGDMIFECFLGVSSRREADARAHAYNIYHKHLWDKQQRALVKQSI